MESPNFKGTTMFCYISYRKNANISTVEYISKCTVMTSMGKESKKEWIYVYVKLTHFAVYNTVNQPNAYIFFLKCILLPSLRSTSKNRKVSWKLKTTTTTTTMVAKSLKLLLQTL